LKTVLDASTIITLVKRHGENSIDIMKESTTIALAPYEIGNTFRTETMLTKTLTTKEADRLLYIIYRIITPLSLETPTTADQAITTLETARKTETSYYDAAYITEAKRKGLPLATEDRRLAEKARKMKVKTVNAEALSSQTTSASMNDSEPSKKH